MFITIWLDKKRFERGNFWIKVYGSPQDRKPLEECFVFPCVFTGGYLRLPLTMCLESTNPTIRALVLTHLLDFLIPFLLWFLLHLPAISLILFCPNAAAPCVPAFRLAHNSFLLLTGVFLVLTWWTLRSPYHFALLIFTSCYHFLPISMSRQKGKLFTMTGTQTWYPCTMPRSFHVSIFASSHHEISLLWMLSLYRCCCWGYIYWMWGRGKT